MAKKNDVYGLLIHQLDVAWITRTGPWGKLTEAQYKKKRQGFIKKAAEQKRKK